MKELTFWKTSFLFTNQTIIQIMIHLFGQKKDFKNATIQQSIKVISNYAFFCCIHLTQIIIPSSVKSIGCNALNKCSKLTYILIPSSVESIGDRAFSSG